LINKVFTLKVSLITVCYNNIDTIKDCLSSVKSQTYHNIEHIVIDGLSDDGTIEFLQSCQDQLTTLESGHDDGIYDALNKGLSHVTGDIVGIVHADDLLVDEFSIESIVDCFENHPEADIVIANANFFDSTKNKKIIRIYRSSNFKPWMMRFGFMPAHTATFIRKSIFDRYGKYKTNYISAGDFDLFVRLLLIHRVPYFLLDKTISSMGTGGMSTSGLSSYWRTSIEILRALRENGISSNWVFILFRLPIKASKRMLYLISKKLS
jgi:glycosyltransferase involved in cell wall biosynthesis